MLTFQLDSTLAKLASLSPSLLCLMAVSGLLHGAQFEGFATFDSQTPNHVTRNGRRVYCSLAGHHFVGLLLQDADSHLKHSAECEALAKTALARARRTVK